MASITPESAEIWQACRRCGAAIVSKNTCLACFFDPEPAPVEIEGFEIGELIGRGGMGIVYKARQTRLDRTVAIKIVDTERDDANAGRRFEREAHVLGRLNHPNIVTVHDWGESEGRCYLVMEHVEGCSLAKLLPLDLPDVIRVGVAVSEALAYAHERGVIHRDIKPANVLIGLDGSIRVADFGIARITDDSGEQKLTGSGLMVGTPYYLAPEILAGAPADARSDVYSMGVLLYEMRTGSLPIGSFDSIDGALDGIVRRALSTDPARRYASATELRQALAGARQEPVAPTKAPKREQPATTGDSVERPRRRALVAAVLVLAAGVALGVFVRRRDQPARPDEPQTIEGAARELTATAISDAATAPLESGPAPLANPLDGGNGAIAAAAKIDPPPPTKPAREAKKEGPGTLVVRATPWAELTIDGAPMPRVEPPRGTFELKSGRHRVVLSNPVTGVSRSLGVTIKPGETTRIAVDLSGAAP